MQPHGFPGQTGSCPRPRHPSMCLAAFLVATVISMPSLPLSLLATASTHACSCAARARCQPRLPCRSHVSLLYSTPRCSHPHRREHGSRRWRPASRSSESEMRTATCTVSVAHAPRSLRAAQPALSRLYKIFSKILYFRDEREQRRWSRLRTGLGELGIAWPLRVLAWWQGAFGAPCRFRRDPGSF